MLFPSESIKDLEARLRRASPVSNSSATSVSGSPKSPLEDEPLPMAMTSFSDVDLASSLTRRISQLSEEADDEVDEDDNEVEAAAAPQKPLTVSELRALIYNKYGEWTPPGVMDLGTPFDQYKLGAGF